MKNYLSTILTCLLFAGMFLPAVAQQSQTTTPKITDQQIKDTQVSTAAALVSNIGALVKLTDDQKAKLQTALQQSAAKSDEARQAIKGDDTKLQAWREAKVADIVNQLKAILTPEQFDVVMKASEKSR